MMTRLALPLIVAAALALCHAPSVFAQPCPVAYKPALAPVPAKVPALGNGQLPPVNKWVAVAATQYNGIDWPGKFHVNKQPLTKDPYPCTFAELSSNWSGSVFDYAALGGLPDGALVAVYCFYRFPQGRTVGRRVMLVKRDVGRGGVGNPDYGVRRGTVGQLYRALDMWDPEPARSSPAKWCGMSGVKTIYIMRVPALAAKGGLQPDYGVRARWDGQRTPKVVSKPPKVPASESPAPPVDPTPAPTPTLLPAIPPAVPEVPTGGVVKGVLTPDSGRRLALKDVLVGAGIMYLLYILVRTGRR